MVIPKKKQGFEVHKAHGVNGMFKNLEKLKSNVLKDISSPTLYGCIQPSHGNKGKKCWLTNEIGLKEGLQRE